MHQLGQPGFKYFVGIGSLDRIANRDDRVCVLNILGNESRSVTPTSHAWSGGNVVFGTAPGRAGEELETPVGGIPVFDNVRDGLEAGHAFNTGVVYLPPAAVRHGVYELVRVNPELEKIVIITEKVPVHDARAIRAVTQQLGIDVFGANCLGVADAWNRVRIGGALGGDAPGEALHKGSVAVYSNSGNFTTTIATYLSMAGWGTTTLVSSGKDHYIHYASPEWAWAFEQDPRSAAAVMYVEPGGDYERGLEFTKPVVACVVGKWKERLTRPVGHAGAVSGSGTSAQDKEGWLMEAVGVEGIWTPEDPVHSERGAVVTNIAHIPSALTQVMAARGVKPDFEPRGSLALKPWFGNAQGLPLAPELDLPVVEAIEPYREQIELLNRQVGAIFPRQTLKDASGASRMDPESGVSSIHGVPVLDAGLASFESNLGLALLHSPPSESGEALIRVAVTAFAHLHGEPELMAAEAARTTGNSPAVVLSAAASVVGPNRVDRARETVDLFIDLLGNDLEDAADLSFDLSTAAASERWAEVRRARPGGGSDGRTGDDRGGAMARALEALGVPSVPLELLRRVGLDDDEDRVLGAIAATLAWDPIRRRRISRTTARNLPWFLRLYGTLLGAAVPAEAHEAGGLLGVSMEEWLTRRTLVDLAFRALVGVDPTEGHRVALRMLLGLLVTNGPGTISAQGAKGAVSADGPETPERVQLNKAMIGFLSHTGYSHGGNGYEGIDFLLGVFRETGLEDPGVADPGLDLRELARRYALDYAEEKARARAVGDPVRTIPGINHPVYRGQPVNLEPREVFIADFFRERGEPNVFHRFYKELVEVLFEEGVTRNVFCVNIDAVIAALLLKMMWPRYRAGEVSAARLEEAAFVLFLFGRMIGCAAEADDHLNRGRNMDTRTPASACRFVS
jgi:succinyl-CoA synthetase alpha subunit